MFPERLSQICQLPAFKRLSRRVTPLAFAIVSCIAAVGPAKAQNPPTNYAPFSTPYNGSESWYCERVSATSNGRCSVTDLFSSAVTLSNLATAGSLTTTGTVTTGGAASAGYTLNLGTISYIGTLPVARLPFAVPVPVASGGTGSAAPALVAGSGISITGSWPNNTIAEASGGFQNASPANPAGITGTTLKMLGLGSTLTFTPSRTGIATFNIIGQVSSGANQCKFELIIGTGAAPANGAAVTGTVLTTAYSVQAGGSSPNPMILIGLSPSLTLSTNYWFDVALASTNAANTCTASNITGSAMEQ